MSSELQTLNQSSYNIEILTLSCADFSTAVSKRQLQDIQIAHLRENLLIYNFDFNSLPNTFVNAIDLKNIRLLEVDGIEKLAKWQERLVELSVIFPNARISIGTKLLKLPEKAVENVSVSTSKITRSASPPPLRIEAATNNLSPIGRNFKFFPPKEGFSSFLSDDHVLDSDIYTSFDSSKRGIISELNNSSVAQGVIFFDGEKFRANFEMSIDKKDDSKRLLKECSDLKDRIEGHFERKILLFYSLLVASYKGFCSHFNESFLEIGETDYQIGKGDLSKGLSGAHSSLIARINLTFDPAILFGKYADYDSNDQLDAYERATCEIAEHLSKSELITPMPRDIDLAKEWVKMTFKSFRVPYVPIESFLGQNLASTMCLPHYCNNLDSALEYYLRQDCISILNQVYKGRITPLKASLDFLDILHQALTRIKINYESVRKNRDDSYECLKKLLSVFTNLYSEDYKTSIVDFSKLYQNPLINPILGIIRLKASIERILSHTTACYLEDLKDLIRHELVHYGFDWPDVIFDRKILIDPKRLPFDIMKKIYAKLISKLKSDMASFGYLTELCLDFPQLFENDHADESDEESLQHSLRSWFVDLFNSTIKGKHKIFLASSSFGIEAIRRALLDELKIIFDVDSSLKIPKITFKKDLEKSFKEFISSAAIEEKIHLIPIIDLYLELMQFTPKQYEYFFQSSLATKIKMTEEEMMISQMQLLKKKHNVYFSKLSIFGSDPNFLNIPIFFVLERVEDCADYPNGLKLVIDKPKYFHTPHFSIQFKTHLVTRFGSSLSLAVGDIKSGMFWI
jgi:hypothetical protein